MKTILLIIALTLSASAATLYPVMTDNSGRTFSGGATNLALLNATNQIFVGTNTFNTNTILGTAKLQDTLDGKPTVALTNVARLDQAQTFAGVNTFSNTNSTWAGTATRYLPLTGGTMTGALTVPSADGAGLKFSGGGTIEDYSNNMVFTSPYTGFAFYSPQVGANVLTTDNTSATFALNFTIAASKSFGWAGTGCAMAGAAALAATAYTEFTFTTTGGSTRLAAAIGNDGALKSYGSHSGGGANYVRASLSASTTEVTLAAETAGTGADNIPINLVPAGTSGVVIGSGGAGITKILSATASLDFNLTSAVVEDLTITVTGAATGDVVTLGVPAGSVTSTVQFTAWVSAADTVTVRARTSAAGENPASGTFRATVIKH